MNIYNILAIEVLRDGGSLVVSFQADDACNYWIMFPIANRDINNPTFHDPVLINRTTGIEVNFSLAGARNWLRKIEPLLHERRESARDYPRSEEAIFNKMLALCGENA